MLTIAQTDRGPNMRGTKTKSSLRNKEIFGLDSWCISIDVRPKSSYMKPICLHDFLAEYSLPDFNVSVKYVWICHISKSEQIPQSTWFFFPTKMRNTTFWKSTWLGPTSSSSVWGGVFLVFGTESVEKNTAKKNPKKMMGIWWCFFRKKCEMSFNFEKQMFFLNGCFNHQVDTIRLSNVDFLDDQFVLNRLYSWLIRCWTMLDLRVCGLRTPQRH